MEQKEFIELFQQNYDKIVNYLSWTMDKRISLILASRYSAAGKVFSPASFSAVTQEIKKQTGWLSTLRTNSSLLHCVAMMLDDKEDPNQAVKQLIDNEERLKSVKFKRSPYSYIAALFLTDEQNQKEKHAENAKMLYDAIRKHHPFLTSYEDMPYSVLLSNNDDDCTTRAETMNRYYTELRNAQFPIGNHLQWLSQILTFHSAHYLESLVPYVVKLREELKEAGVKIKKEHYPLIGFLAIAGAKDEHISQLVELYNNLKTLKLFRWYKDMTFSVAVQKELRHLVSLNKSVEMGVVTSLEMAIQAEQAMMLTVTMTAVAASASSD